VIDGDGTGNPGDESPATDEDDADPENVEIFDLALRKTTAVTAPVKLGQDVPFTITVFNQGNITATDIEVNDYIPAGFQLANNTTGANGSGWSGAGTPSSTVTTTIAGPIAPGASQDITINLTVIAAGDEASDYINVAEINAAKDENGIDRTNDDTDSTPDNNATNDAGGQNNSPADDAIDGDGTGTPDGVDPTTDEDDSDPEDVKVFDLALRKTITSTAPVKVGNTVTFEIEVLNQGNITAENIVINDYIPAGYDIAADQLAGAGGIWSGSGAAGSTVTATIAGPLAPGATTTISIDLVVNNAGNEAENYINIAEVKSAEGDGIDQTNNDKDSTPDNDPTNDAGGAVMTDSDDIVLGDGTGVPGDENPATDEDDADPAKATIFDLALAKTTNVTTPVKLGDVIPFTITVTNQGNVAAQNIEINDYIPAGFELTNSTTGANGNNWTGAGTPGTTVTTTITGPIAPGANLPITINLTVVAAGNEATDYINVAEINAAQDDQGTDRTNDDKDSQPDAIIDNDAGGLVDSPADDAIDGNGLGTPNDGNAATDEDDSDPENVLVFDLAVRKTAGITIPAKVGDVIPFTITVFNQGNITATDVVINDYIPAGFERADNLAGANGTNWTGAGTPSSTTTTTIAGPLAPGADLAVTINLRVIDAGDEGDDYINRTEISSAKDEEGNDQSDNDKDSTPDNDPTNDAGGNPMTDSDDAIDGDGTGNPNDTDAATDEDDSDPFKLPIFDLALAKTSNVTAPVKLGDIIQFTITVTNQGNITAQNIEINDYIPAGFTRSGNSNGLNAFNWDGLGAPSTTTKTTIQNPLARLYQPSRN